MPLGLVDQGSFYRNTSPSASWHLHSTKKFLSIKELAGRSRYCGRYLTCRKGREEQLPALNGGKEERGSEYCFLTLVWGEELIHSATSWWEERRVSLTTALGHGGDTACDNLRKKPPPKSVKMLCVCRERSLFFGRWRRTNCWRHSVAARVSIQGWSALSSTAVLI